MNSLEDMRTLLQHDCRPTTSKAKEVLAEVDAELARLKREVKVNAEALGSLERLRVELERVEHLRADAVESEHLLRAELEQVKRERDDWQEMQHVTARDLDSARADNAALEAKRKTAADAHPGCGLLDDLAGECQCKAREQRLRVELEP